MSQRTVYRLVNQKHKTSSVAVQTSQRGRKPVLTAEDREDIRRCIDEKPDITTYQGGTTGERFVQYLKETLLPTLRSGDIVVMDNMRSHYVKPSGRFWKRTV